MCLHVDQSEPPILTIRLVYGYTGVWFFFSDACFAVKTTTLCL